MVRRVFAVPCTLSIFAATFAFAAPAFAASANHSSANFTFVKKPCAVVEVHLDGTNHTARCLHATMPAYSPQLIANIQPATNCSSLDTLRVWSNGYGTVTCFTGTGYLGYQINNVNEVDNVSGGEDAWFKWYHHDGGHYCTVDSQVFLANGTNSQIQITQVDVGDSNGSDC